MRRPPLPSPVLDPEAAACPPGTGAAERDVAAQRPLLSRLVTPRVAALFARNTIVSCATFLFDLVLLWALVRLLGMDKYVAATIGFIVATSIHYAIGRLWIFVGSRRGLSAGYVYFLFNAMVGLGATIALFACFTELVGLPYLVARVVASIFAGIVVFLLNAVLNFKSV